jgi:hypothetical protein
VHIVLGHGDGTFAAPVTYATPTGEPTRIVAQDMNGDGFADLVVTHSDVPGTFSVLAGNGDGSFQSAVDYATGDQPGPVGVGDPDGDGDFDLIVGSADGALEAFNNDSFHRATTAVKGITVTPVDDAPIAVDDAVGTPENAALNFDARTNDSDLDGPRSRWARST